jgi:hypothetical protein
MKRILKLSLLICSPLPTIIQWIRIYYGVYGSITISRAHELATPYYALSALMFVLGVLLLLSKSAR